MRGELFLQTGKIKTYETDFQATINYCYYVNAGTTKT